MIYIDDILLFSPIVHAHNELLHALALLTKKYEILLAKKKKRMVVRSIEIYFLGIQLSQGQYKAQPYISQELLRFPDKSLEFQIIHSRTPVASLRRLVFIV